MSRREFAMLAASVIGCLAIGGGGAALTGDGVRTWYPTIVKPSWNPPSAVFGPVWTTLFMMMGVAAWLVWRRAGWDGARPALLLFGAQLVLNLAWSGLFFGLRRPDLALIEIVVLLAAIVATALAFRPHSSTAAALLVPYALWVSFATVLNATIWRLNR